MTRNRRLDEFVDAQAGGDTHADDAPAGGDTHADDAPAGEDAPSSAPGAVPIYRWVSQDTSCAACETTVERLWLEANDDAERRYVCRDCKEW